MFAYRSPAPSHPFVPRRVVLRELLAGAIVLGMHTVIADGFTDSKRSGRSKNAASPASSPNPDRTPRIVAQHLARHYRIAEPLARQIVSSAWLHAQRPPIDPLLVLAIVGVESGHNPRAVSSEGAQGLMQIMPRYHSGRLKALRPGASLFDPDANIEVGVNLLHEMITRCQGNLRLALQRYNGAPRDREARYAGRVLTEMARLHEAVAAIA
jgi:soluble lytic murein transglycosylase-like protein